MCAGGESVAHAPTTGWDSCGYSQIPGVPLVISQTVADSGSRRLALVQSVGEPEVARGEIDGSRPGLADVFSLHCRRAGAVRPENEREFFFETLAEYQWARDAAGLVPHTIDLLVKPVIEICEHYGTVPWKLEPRDLDQFFAGPGKRARATVRSKITKIDHYFAFLEQRYAGEISRRFGAAVVSPVDAFNRPHHRGEFGLRVPPSQRAMREFLGNWRAALPSARKEMVACRDYVMAKLAYVSGVRAAELCGVRISDVHWEVGQWGRFLVQGKGARGSGPRQREAFMFEQGRELLWWYIEEVRGMFPDDPEHPLAPLFPSERSLEVMARVNSPVAPAVVPAGVEDGVAAASAGPGRRALPASAASRLRDAQLRVRHVAVGGPAAARARLDDYDGALPGHGAGRPGARGALLGRACGPAAGVGQGELAVKWNLRWAAARRDIWRPTDLLSAFQQVGFNPSLSKVAALWGAKPITVRLDDLDLICQALGCTVADLLEAEPVAEAGDQGRLAPAVGAENASAVRPIARRSGPRRLTPPN